MAHSKNRSKKLISSIFPRAAMLIALIFVFSAGSTAFASTGTNSSTEASLSQNWAGYAATGSTYTGVTGTWTVPTATSSTAVAADATWVGIGGASDTNLIQAGTQAISENGSVTYQAWYELLPSTSTIIPLSVKPGDSITATISYLANNQWFISIVDNTTNQYYTNTVNYTSTNSSVEWVQEMPSDENGYLPLDNFGTVAFTNATATVNGQSETIAQTNAHLLDITNGATLLAQTSSLGSDGESFSVTRTDSSSDVMPQSIDINPWSGWRTGRGDESQSGTWDPFGNGFGPGPVVIPGFSPSDFLPSGFGFDTGTSSDLGVSGSSSTPTVRTIQIPGYGTVTETTQTFGDSSGNNGYSFQFSF